MSKLLHAPEALEKPSIEIHPVDLEKEDPELFQLLKLHAEAEASLPEVKAAGSWYRAGTGPQPTNGGVWVGGDILKPLTTPPATAVVSKIDYDYSPQYGGWASQVSVRLYITNAAVTQAWTADVTADTEGTVNTSGVSIPANCRITYQMKVGNTTGGLFNPPKINGCDVRVYWP